MMKKLIDILEKRKPGIDFEKNERLVEDGYLDSLDIFAIILEIEKQFSIEIDPAQIDPDNFQNVTGIWNMIQKSQIQK